MFRVCIHGRGGQGVVTAAELLARAAFAEGHQVQAIPSFGSERTGAPVVSYCRIDDVPIRTREPIEVPDGVIVQDPTLLHAMNPFQGMDRDGWAVVNTRLSPNEVRDLAPSAPATPGHVACVPADDIVREYLGRPIPSAALLGAFAALTRQVSLESVFQVINERFTGKVATGNARSAEIAYSWVVDHADDEDAGAPEGIAHLAIRPDVPDVTDLDSGLVRHMVVRDV